MKVKLWKKPKNPIVIEGFPGFGLVGTIASEFLIDHLKTEQIGKIIFDEMPPMVAIHESRIVEPLGIFYSKQFNAVILHAVTASAGFEWKLAESLVDIATQLNAKEIISLEGVGSSEDAVEQKAFYYTSDSKKKKVFEKIGIEPLKEGIIMGVTGAIMLKRDHIPVSCIFAETHSNLPDSKAAAMVVEVLDKYLGLGVDTGPLLEQATKFEGKLKNLMTKSKQALDISEKKRMSYVG